MPPQQSNAGPVVITAIVLAVMAGFGVLDLRLAGAIAVGGILFLIAGGRY